jgi:four helix bundle protein
MKYERFEELPVWKAAIELAERVYRMSKNTHLAGRGDLPNQLQRAALSVSNNIAEGFERGTTQELITFIYVARGSTAEVRSTLCFMERLPDLDHLKSQISDLRSLSESISRQLRAWAGKLQDSDLKGQRHLTDKVREKTPREREAQEFEAELARIVAEGRE